MRRDFYLYYIPVEDPPPSGFSEHNLARPRVLKVPDGLRLEWHLPAPVRAYRLDIPARATFRIVSFDASSAFASVIVL